MKAYKITDQFADNGIRFCKGDIFTTDGKEGILIYDECEYIRIGEISLRLRTKLLSHSEEI